MSTANRILRDAKVQRTVDPDKLAAALGLRIEDNPRLPPKTLGLADKIGQRILLAPRQMSQRRAFTVAHELSEHLPVPEQLELELEQRFHDAVASELLAPEGEFIEAVAQFGLDLDALRSRFPSASREVIVRRFSDLAANAITSKWESLALRWRSASRKLPKSVIQLEDRVATAACLRRGPFAWAETRKAFACAWRTSAFDARPGRETPRRALALVILKPR